MADDPHAGKVSVCTNQIDGQMCNTKLTWEDHGRYVSSPPRELGYESGALAFECPECGNAEYRCATCFEPDSHAAPGYFIGESTGKQIACPNCNQEEVRRERRSVY